MIPAFGVSQTSAGLQDNTWGGEAGREGELATWSVWCLARVSTRVLLACRCGDRRFSADAGGHGQCPSLWSPQPVILGLKHAPSGSSHAWPPCHPARALLQKPGCLGGIPHPEPGGALVTASRWSTPVITAGRGAPSSVSSSCGNGNHWAPLCTNKSSPFSHLLNYS